MLLMVVILMVVIIVVIKLCMFSDLENPDLLNHCDCGRLLRVLLLRRRCILLGGRWGLLLIFFK
jgi:hypothetical protein